jgi:hypothetical protein
MTNALESVIKISPIANAALSSRTYEAVRDEYLAHIEICPSCHRNRFGKNGPTLTYWTVVEFCGLAERLLKEIEQML